ncbi:MAG: type IV toxin-antitoxin system AbiEi family antitoxin [Candidatus Aminicenantes bacterium]|nr:type IV toxin-antitoxin system AbiEi family antitoxin [Candidatus Aminicenantes bacterium]
MKNKNSASLSDWIDVLQRSGVYSFTREKAQKELGIQKNSLNIAFNRLHKQGRILRLRNSFYVIVPLEYRSAGTVPPEWFVDDLMKFIGLPYYVGCLSAAAVYGASHQRPQELQVVVPSHVRMIDLDTVRIRFLRDAGMKQARTKLQRTQTGDYVISTAEWTAIDLIRFQKHFGGPDAVAGVFLELGESMDAERLAEACRFEQQNSLIQRLGWMLENLGFHRLAEPLHREIDKRDPSYVTLNPTLKKRFGLHNSTWRVIVNDKPEIG